MKGGRSASGEWTVRRSVEKMTRDDFASGGLHDVKGGRSTQGVRTVRPSNFKFVQRCCLSECSECLNADGPPIGHGQSAKGSNGQL